MERLRESKWVYVLLSIFLAIVFWMYVRAEQDPPQTAWYNNVPVQITGGSVLTRQGLTVASLSAERVDLKIEAPASVQDILVRNRKEFYVTVDVSKCVEGENSVRYIPVWPINTNPESITTVDRKPGTITVNVEKLYTKTFPVEFQLHGTVAKGYQLGAPAINPESVVISGAVEQVSQVAKVAAILEHEELSERFTGDLPLRLFDAAGQELTELEVTMDAASVYVVLPVVVVKEVPLTVNILPGGGATELDAKWKIEPRRIIVSGAESDLKNLKEISLGSVELSKVMGTSTLTFPISLDPSLENISGVTEAEVTVTVDGLSTRSFEVDNIQLTNVRQGYKGVPVNLVRTIVVRGREEDLEKIDVSQLSIVADVSDFTASGTYTVPASKVKVYLNAGGSVGVIGDYSIVVNISK